MVKDPLDEFDIKTKTSRPSELIPSQVVLRIIVRPTRSNVEYRYPVKIAKPKKVPENSSVSESTEDNAESFEISIERYEKSFRYKSVLNHPDFVSKKEVDENSDDDEKAVSFNWVDALLDKPHSSFDHETCIPCTKAVYKKRKLYGTEISA